MRVGSYWCFNEGAVIDVLSIWRCREVSRDYDGASMSLELVYCSKEKEYEGNWEVWDRSMETWKEELFEIDKEDIPLYILGEL